MQDDIERCIKEFHEHANRPLHEDMYENRRSHQNPSYFAIPSLSSQPFWDIPEIEEMVEKNTECIRKEFEQSFNKHLRTENIQKDLLSGTWTVGYLMEEGVWVDKSVLENHFPATLAVLQSLPILNNGMGYIYFSKLTNNARIRSHCGPTNIKLRIQFPIHLTNGWEKIQSDPLTTLTVDGISRCYETGKAIIFDDSIYHHVQVGPGVERIVLIIDIWHPELQRLSETVRSSISALFPIDPQLSLTPTAATASSPVSTEQDPVKKARDFLLPVDVSYTESTTISVLVVGELPANQKQSFLRALDNPLIPVTSTSSATTTTEEKSFQMKRARCQWNPNVQFQTNLLLWNVPSSDRMKVGSMNYYERASGIILLFDVFDHHSFTKLQEVWLEDMHRQGWQGQGVGLVVGIVDNNNAEHKGKREVSSLVGMAFAEKHQMMYLECNVKTTNTSSSSSSLAGSSSSIPLDAVSTILHGIITRDLPKYTPAFIDRMQHPSVQELTSSPKYLSMQSAGEIFVPDDLVPPRSPREDGMQYDYLLKFLMIGDSGVGKSCFILRACDDTFTDSYISTIGVDFKLRSLNVRRQDGTIYRVKTQIWDVAGPERFLTITASYYRGAMGIFLCFDLYDRYSFESLQQHWMSEIQKYATHRPIVILVGMKSDGLVSGSGADATRKEREVSYEEALRFAVEQGLPYGECSSRTGEQVQDVFGTMVYYIMEEKLPRLQEMKEEQKRREQERAAEADARNRRNNNNSRCMLS